MLRENKRMLDKAIRELDREKMGLQTQEKKLIGEIKAFAKTNNLSSTVVKERLRKMGAWEDGDCCVGGRKHGRGVMGVVMLETEDGDDLD